MMTHTGMYRQILSRMGYYAYQRGLIDNHLSQNGGWEGHLQNCRRFTLAATELFRPQRITVLGSGWLLDFPLAEILEMGIEVRLIDIVHPPELVRQAGELKAVELVESDITGGLIEAVWDATRGYGFLRKLKSLDGIMVPEYEPGFDPGMVVSLNILTQLESRLLAWLRSRARIETEAIDRFRLRIQEQHIRFLKRHRSVLISDYSEVFTRPAGDEPVQTILAELPGGELREDWTWDYDLKGRESYTSRSIMKVTARAF